MLERFVHARQFLGHERIENIRRILQLFRQRIDTRHLIIPRPAFVAHQLAVKRRGLFANSLFSGDRAAFRGGHDFLAHFLKLVRQLRETLGQRRVLARLRGALQQRITHGVDVVHVETHIAQQIVDAHRRRKILCAIRFRKFRPRIQRDHHLCDINFFAARQLHRVRSRQHPWPLRRFKRRRRRGRHVRSL